MPTTNSISACLLASILLLGACSGGSSATDAGLDTVIDWSVSEGTLPGDGPKLKPDTAVSPTDWDGDGLSNEDEKKLGTDPRNKDTDGDGIDDLTEVGDPSSPKDSDGDKRPDALEPNDFDSDKDGKLDDVDTNDTDGPCGKSPRLLVLATLSQDRLLTKACSPYRVQGFVWMVGGATLSSEPGVTVELGAGAAILLGDGSGKGSLKLEGTSSEKVRLTTEAQPAKKASWRGIAVENGGIVRLLHTQVEGAGGATGSADPQASLYVKSAQEIALVGVTFSQSSGHGLHAALTVGSGPLFSAFEGTSFSAVEIPAQLHIRHLTEIGQGNNFGTGGVVEVVSDTVDKTAVWKAIGVPYRMTEATLTVEASLTLEAGVSLELPAQAVIDVAYTSPSAALLAAGTVAKPIQIGTAGGKAGSWNGIIIYQGSSSLTNTILTGGGQNSSKGVEATLYLDRDATLVPSALTVKAGAGYGAYYYRNGSGCNGIATTGFVFSGSFPGSTGFPGCKLFCLDDTNSPGVCLVP